MTLFSWRKRRVRRLNKESSLLKHVIDGSGWRWWKPVITLAISKQVNLLNTDLRQLITSTELRYVEAGLNHSSALNHSRKQISTIQASQLTWRVKADYNSKDIELQ